MRMRSVLLAGLAWMVSAQAQAGAELENWLTCRDSTVLSDDGRRLSAAAQAQGYSCREHSGLRRDVLACGGGTARVLGAQVREFERARQADGSVILSVVLNANPGSLQQRFERVLGSSDLARSLHAELDSREDGRAELRCRLAGDRSPHGAIAGSLDFRGQQPLPAMRVCATPVSKQASPVCVQTRTGQVEYLIEQLPAGDYYITAFATENNPNRLFGVYSSPMSNCRSDDAACGDRRRLQPVSILPGDVRSGIDPHTLLPELPAFLRNRAP